MKRQKQRKAGFFVERLLRGDRTAKASEEGSKTQKRNFHVIDEK